jgi:large subunit ribosomal protein L6
MSRVGENPITIPNTVTITTDANQLTVSGPKGNLSLTLLPQVKVEQDNSQLLVKRKKDDKFSKSAHGLTRSLLNNMVIGVTEGWKKDMEMVGVGYRAAGGGDTLTLSVGFSHPVVIKAPEGITFTVAENTKLSVSGIDRTLVGQVAANIRGVKPPEPYKGKGIRYAGEYVRRKAGKAGKAAGGK